MDRSTRNSRKRTRSPSADCEECMPISKRIHKLNIRARGSIDDDGAECDGMSTNNNLSRNCCCSTDRCQPQPGTSSATDSAQWLAAGGNSRLNGHTPQHQHHHAAPPAEPPHVMQHHLAAPPDLPAAADLGLLETYEPDLDAADNPHYYHQNRLLYDAHIQRVRRTKSE